jgi:hypothetical protein
MCLNGGVTGVFRDGGEVRYRCLGFFLRGDASEAVDAVKVADCLIVLRFEVVRFVFTPASIGCRKEFD